MHAEYNLLFVPKAKPLLAIKGTKSLNFRHPLLVFIIDNSLLDRCKCTKPSLYNGSELLLSTSYRAKLFC